MKQFETILETVFVKDWNTTALILKDKVVVRMWFELYMTEEECFNHIHQYMPGLVQTSNRFKEYREKGIETAIKSDPLEPYEKLFAELNEYGKTLSNKN